MAVGVAVIPIILSDAGLWRCVEDIAFTLGTLGYTSPEQLAPVPTWPRVASANVELEVVRDVIEQADRDDAGAPVVDRCALFDAMVDVAWARCTYAFLWCLPVAKTDSMRKNMRRIVE